MSNHRIMDRRELDYIESLSFDETDRYEWLDRIQSQLDEAIRLYRDEGCSLGKASDVTGVGVLNLMAEISRRKLQLIGSAELAEAGAQAIAEAFDDPGFLELFQRGKERLTEQRPAEAHKRTIELPPLTEAQARALVVLIEREEHVQSVRERAMAYETGAALSETAREDLASLKAFLLRVLGQNTTIHNNELGKKRISAPRGQFVDF